MFNPPPGIFNGIGMREKVPQIKPDLPVVGIALQPFEIGLTPAADHIFSSQITLN
jgi:hypothetical protein